MMQQKIKRVCCCFLVNNKILIVLNAASGGTCIISSVSVIGAPVGIAGASFTIMFF